MRAQRLTALPAGIIVIAGPWILCRMTHHPGPDRVEFNVPVTSLHVSFGRHHTALVPPLPQGARPLAGIIGISHIAAANRLDYLRDRKTILWRHQQVRVIGHQYIRVNHAPIPIRSITQTFQVEVVVFFTGETRLAVVATLYDMRGHTGKVMALLARRRKPLLLLK